MTRRYDRIEYSSGRARRFIIVPNTNFMGDYVNKYGSDVVFRFANFADAMSLCGDGRGEFHVRAPGSARTCLSVCRETPWERARGVPESCKAVLAGHSCGVARPVGGASSSLGRWHHCGIVRPQGAEITRALAECVILVAHQNGKAGG